MITFADDGNGNRRRRQHFGGDCHCQDLVVGRPFAEDVVGGGDGEGEREETGVVKLRGIFNAVCRGAHCVCYPRAAARADGDIADAAARHHRKQRSGDGSGKQPSRADAHIDRARECDGEHFAHAPPQINIVFNHHRQARSDERRRGARGRVVVMKHRRHRERYAVHRRLSDFNEGVSAEERACAAAAVCVVVVHYAQPRCAAAQGAHGDDDRPSVVRARCQPVIQSRYGSGVVGHGRQTGIVESGDDKRMSVGDGMHRAFGDGENMQGDDTIRRRGVSVDNAVDRNPIHNIVVYCVVVVRREPRRQIKPSQCHDALAAVVGLQCDSQTAARAVNDAVVRADGAARADDGAAFREHVKEGGGVAALFGRFNNDGGGVLIVRRQCRMHIKVQGRHGRPLVVDGRGYRAVGADEIGNMPAARGDDGYAREERRAQHLREC